VVAVSLLLAVSCGSFRSSLKVVSLKIVGEPPGLNLL
jgi:hypothetical protein